MDVLLARVALNKGEETYLDALSDLVGTYEDEHHAIEPASDAEMLQHLLDAKGMTQAQLSRETDLPKSTISEVLKGRKRFSPDDPQAGGILSSRCVGACGEHLKAFAKTNRLTNNLDHVGRRRTLVCVENTDQTLQESVCEYRRLWDSESLAA